MAKSGFQNSLTKLPDCHKWLILLTHSQGVLLENSLTKIPDCRSGALPAKKHSHEPKTLWRSKMLATCPQRTSTVDTLATVDTHRPQLKPASQAVETCGHALSTVPRALSTPSACPQPPRGSLTPPSATRTSCTGTSSPAP
jgi:hypothetical protein